MRFCTIFLITSVISHTWALSPPTPLKNTPGVKIINGDAAILGQFPWQIGIQGRNSLGGYFCGGSIISPEWILTAAHCLYGAKSAMIYSGTTKISDRNKTVTPAASFILHENYNPATLNNDIGLIKMSKPLVFNENTHAIALAVRDPKVGSTVTVSGWGLRNDSDIYVSDVLYYTSVSTIENNDCVKIYGSSVILPGVMCAIGGNPYTSPCQGDSGAPVVVMNSCGKPVQVGVFSFTNGYGCEYPLPSGNTRVAYFRDWITEKTGI